MQPVISASISVRVPFHDVDPAGIVWHGHYYKYFETARCALLEKINYSYTRMLETGLIWPITEISTKFVKPVTFDQLIDVQAMLKEWEYRIRIDYEITNSLGEVVTKARTDQVPLDLQTLSMHLGSPDALLDGVSAALDLVR